MRKKTNLNRKTAEGRRSLAAIASEAARDRLQSMGAEEKAAYGKACAERSRKTHASFTDEQKAAIKEKRRQSLLAYWATRKGLLDTERSAKISAAQLKTHARRTPKELEALREHLRKASAIGNSKPKVISEEGKLRATQKREAYWTKEARLKAAEHSKKVRQNRDDKEQEAINARRSATYNSRSDKDKAATSVKISSAYLSKSPEERRAILERVYDTKRKRGTFRTSTPEDDVYYKLCDHFGEDRVHRNYKSSVYPFACDFVVNLRKGKSHVKDALFIECNFHWTHGGAPYDAASNKHQAIVKRWLKKSRTSQYFKTAIQVWCERDVQKRNMAIGLSWFEFFTPAEFDAWFNVVTTKPKIAGTYTNDKLAYAYERMASKAPVYANDFTFNFMPHFYKPELELWLDQVMRFRLFANRKKYLGKSAQALTPQEILAGFRKAGLTHRSHYSHFPVGLVRKFCEVADPEKVYDPFAGWGHRMVAFSAMNVDYVGTDLWLASVNGCARISKWLSDNDLLSGSVKQGDAAKRNRRASNHDAVFTCPPYPGSVEVYKGDGAELLPLPKYWSWWRQVVHSSVSASTKWFGLVVPSGLISEYALPIEALGFRKVFFELVLANGRTSSHLVKKKNFESIIIWSK